MKTLFELTFTFPDWKRPFRLLIPVPLPDELVVLVGVGEGVGAG